MSLLGVQRDLVDHLRSGATDINSKVRGDAEPRLAVYHNAYRMQLLACLRDTFEKTWSWLGDTAFDDAGMRYIETHSPRAWSLSEYGAQFDETLHVLYPQDPEVAELAWLDWQLRKAFDGPNAAVLTADAAASMDWDQAVLRLVPTFHVRSIVTNCAAIWTALNRGETPPPATVLHDPMALRVWRQALTPRFRSIDPLEQCALAMAAHGETFTAICAQLAEGRDEAEAAAIAGQYLVSWIQDGLLTTPLEGGRPRGG